MRDVLRRTLLGALIALCVSAPAEAAQLCAGTGCEHATAAEAFAVAEANGTADVLRLVGIDEQGTFGDGGERLEVVAVDSVLEGPVTLEHAGSSVGGLVVRGALTTPRAEDVEVQGDLVLGCLLSRHLTVTGDVTHGCPTDPAGVSDSLVLGTVGVPTRYSAYPPQVHDAGPGDVATTDPAALREAGDPAPLGPAERLEDVGGLPRTADADGDGIARRDIGAREHHPVPPAPAAGNLLRNGGAEDGVAHWSAAGIASVGFGEGFFPTAAAANALGAGERFFSGGQVDQGTLTQAVDLRAHAPEIDAGGATVELSALLGGYRADADAALASVAFAGPDGGALGELSLPPVTAFDRGNAITLLRRRVAGAIPPLARQAVVTLRAQRSSGEVADGYFDDVALVATVPPPAPGEPPPPPPDGPPLKPFSGVKVLTASARPDRRGRIRMQLACADATVGRCAGVLTLVAVLHSDELARRVGSAGFALAPGELRRIRLRVTSGAQGALRRRRTGRLRATLYAAARDGQGLTATSTTPLTLRR